VKRKLETQSGFGLPSFNVFMVAVLFVVGCMWVVEVYRYERAELSADRYEALRFLAPKSCAGESHLKQVVAAGPIANNQSGDVEEKLKAFAVGQTMAATKALILDVKVECAQPKPETK
jgi:hypothetical protein